MSLDSNTVSQNNTADDHGLDAESLNAIRSILTEEDKPSPRRTMKRATAAEPASEERDVAPLRRKADDLPPLQSPEMEPKAAAPLAKRGFSLRRKPAVDAPSRPVAQPDPVRTPSPVAAGEAGMMDRIKAYRPKPVHIALGAFALLIVMLPWLVFGVAFLLAIIAIGVFLILGYDGFWQGVMKAGRWYAKRRPERAVVLNKRLDAFAMRWDAVLDRFPEGSVDGLYLPDFGELATAEKRHEDALDRRLSGLSGKPT